jgi:hypothetical protein
MSRRDHLLLIDARDTLVGVIVREQITGLTGRLLGPRSTQDVRRSCAAQTEHI